LNQRELVFSYTLLDSGNGFRQQHRFDEADRMLVQALDESRKFGAESPDVAEVLDSLALLETDRSKFRAAENYAMNSLMIRQRSLGAGHPLVGDSLNTLASVYRAEGRDERAEPLLRRKRSVKCVWKAP
jgi:hypothetical protein